MNTCFIRTSEYVCVLQNLLFFLACLERHPDRIKKESSCFRRWSGGSLALCEGEFFCSYQTWLLLQFLVSGTHKGWKWMILALTEYRLVYSFCIFKLECLPSISSFSGAVHWTSLFFFRILHRIYVLVEVSRLRCFLI